MKSKVFVDTNVLVYAYDIDAGARHDIARTIMNGLWQSGQGIVSIQTLSEFYVVVTRKLKHPIEPAIAREIISNLSTWQVVGNDTGTLLRAIDISASHGCSFWDSMVIASAIKGGACVLLTEDLSNGQVIEGVEVRNPFASPVKPVKPVKSRKSK